MDQQQIHRIAEAIAWKESGIYSLVYFYGNPQGILAALSEITETYKKYCPAAKIIRVNAEAFCIETIHSIREGIFSSQCDCDLYIFENIGAVAGRETIEQRLYGILDWLLEHGRQIIVTGSAPTSELRTLAPRICAQLDGGVSFPMEPA